MPRHRFCDISPQGIIIFVRLATILFFSSFSLWNAAAGEPFLPPILLQLLRDPAVHEELAASPSQVEALLQLTDSVDGRWFASRHFPAADRQREQNRLTAEVLEALPQVLSPQQQTRLSQLQWQGLGTRAVITAQLAALLRLDSGSLLRMRAFAVQTDEAVRELEKKVFSGENLESLESQLRQIQQREVRGILGAMAPVQRKELAEALGAAFDFSRVKRTNPRAPELILASKEKWISGNAVSLRSLRGKVVVVHFFDHQLAGCRENLPYYDAWAKDFADQGIVILGVLTPHRDPASTAVVQGGDDTEDATEDEKVAAALRERGIRYSVLFDRDAVNWHAWGNRTWPTVYLIDRQGFVRTWWEAELAWEGGEGDQAFRQSIQEALGDRAE